MDVDEALGYAARNHSTPLPDDPMDYAVQALLALAAEVERLQAIEHRARFTFTEPLVHPAAEAAARRILGY